MSYRKIETFVNKLFSVSNMARKGKKDMHMTDIIPTMQLRSQVSTLGYSFAPGDAVLAILSCFIS